VSHWENLDRNGEPRQRATRRTAAEIARVVKEQLGLDVGGGVFFGPEENAWDLLRREQQRFQSQIDQVLELLTELTYRLDELAAERL